MTGRGTRVDMERLRLAVLDQLVQRDAETQFDTVWEEVSILIRCGWDWQDISLVIEPGQPVVVEVPE